jgi:hypothetical protein
VHEENPKCARRIQSARGESRVHEIPGFVSIQGARGERGESRVHEESKENPGCAPLRKNIPFYYGRN